MCSERPQRRRAGLECVQTRGLRSWGSVTQCWGAVLWKALHFVLGSPRAPPSPKWLRRPGPRKSQPTREAQACWARRRTAGTQLRCPGHSSAWGAHTSPRPSCLGTGLWPGKGDQGLVVPPTAILRPAVYFCECFCQRMREAGKVRIVSCPSQLTAQSLDKK